jgi:hypothetical protein
LLVLYNNKEGIIMLDCNNEEGVCIIDKVNLSNKIKTISDELTVMYIGDPMCWLLGNIWEKCDKEI